MSQDWSCRASAMFCPKPGGWRKHLAEAKVERRACLASGCRAREAVTDSCGLWLRGTARLRWRWSTPLRLHEEIYDSKHGK
eukprot:5138531-Pleurochrysis_carterae.AAC.1